MVTSMLCYMCIIMQSLRYCVLIWFHMYACNEIITRVIVQGVALQLKESLRDISCVALHLTEKSLHALLFVVLHYT